MEKHQFITSKFLTRVPEKSCPPQHPTLITNCCLRLADTDKDHIKVETKQTIFPCLISIHALTLCLEAFTQFSLGFSIGSQSWLGVEFVGHSGSSNHCLEAARALGHILLRVEENHVHLWHVEQPKGHRGAQAHGDGQRGRLDVHLWSKHRKCTDTIYYTWGLYSIVSVGSGLNNTSDICRVWF